MNSGSHEQVDQRVRKDSIRGIAAGLVLIGVIGGGLMLHNSRGLFAEKQAKTADSVPPAVLNRINVNTAPAESLVRLPGIGPSRAAAIIQYRKQAGEKGSKAFESPGDLQKIKGIGPKTAEKITPYICF